MRFNLAQASSWTGIGCHLHAEGPLVDSSGIFLEKSWTNEWLKYEPSAEIDSIVEDIQ